MNNTNVTWLLDKYENFKYFITGDILFPLICNDFLSLKEKYM